MGQLEGGKSFEDYDDIHNFLGTLYQLLDPYRQIKPNLIICVLSSSPLS